ncbi:MAG TPA: PhzF family phenazine biosynthesis protein [Gemmatimonadales bacterium]|nr:PhzF family phenazine biosynthesis protein [Gemmatimonadales bacterium]
MTARYVHVDVFASGPMSGNGLAVFLHTEGWPTSVLQRLTQEMRQIESIFLSHVGEGGASARIFTEDEELPFAGHPVLGAAAVLHREVAGEAMERTWRLSLAERAVTVTTSLADGGITAEMNQGPATFDAALSAADAAPILQRLRLGAGDLVEGLPVQVVSTGLPYLIVPVGAEALGRAGVTGRDLEVLLAHVGARFAYLVDPVGREGRSWDNVGRVEDIATGSAAGPVGAYLWAHGQADDTTAFELLQGRYLGRPSRLGVRRDGHGNIFVGGEVWPFARGELDIAILHA